MKSVLIHIGYPKAASTTLQNGLFIKLHQKSKINFLGRAWESGNYCGFDCHEDYKIWLKEIIKISSTASSNSEKTLRQCRVFPDISDDKVNLYSEGLFLTNEDHENTILMPQVLRELFPSDAYKVQVLIVIRNQIKLLMSYYVQNYAKIKLKTFGEFLKKCVDEGWSGRYKIFHYYNIIEKYAEVYGKENISILLFEDMVNDLETFCSLLSKTINVKSEVIFGELSGEYYNKTRVRSGGKIVRKVNPTSIRGIVKRVSKIIFPNMRGFGDIHVPPLTKEEKEIILEEFNNGNMKLAKKYSLNISAMQSYGYF